MKIKKTKANIKAKIKNAKTKAKAKVDKIVEEHGEAISVGLALFASIGLPALLFGVAIKAEADANKKAYEEALGNVVSAIKNDAEARENNEEYVKNFNALKECCKDIDFNPDEVFVIEQVDGQTKVSQILDHGIMYSERV